MKQDVDNKRNQFLEETLDEFYSRYAGNRSSLGEGDTEGHVYKMLFNSILEHRLTPGIKLKKVPLTETFCVTRGVIHKVLSRLSSLKLVSLHANRGAAVANPSHKEAADIFDARRLMDIALTKRPAAAKCTAEVSAVAPALAGLM